MVRKSLGLFSLVVVLTSWSQARADLYQLTLEGVVSSNTSATLLSGAMGQSVTATAIIDRSVADGNLNSGKGIFIDALVTFQIDIGTANLTVIDGNVGTSDVADSFDGNDVFFLSGTGATFSGTLAPFASNVALSLSNNVDISLLTSDQLTGVPSFTLANWEQVNFVITDGTPNGGVNMSLSTATYGPLASVVVPAPGAVVLGMIGLGMISTRRKRRAD